VSLCCAVAGQRDTELTQLSEDKGHGETETCDDNKAAVVDCTGDHVCSVISIVL